MEELWVCQHTANVRGESSCGGLSFLEKEDLSGESRLTARVLYCNLISRAAASIESKASEKSAVLELSEGLLTGPFSMLWLFLGITCLREGAHPATSCEC